MHVHFLSHAPIEDFLRDVAVVDSPAACEDDGELLRLSSFLLIGSTATSSFTTVTHQSAFIWWTRMIPFSKHTESPSPVSNQIAGVSSVMFTHEFKAYVTSNFKCRIETEGFLKIYRVTHTAKVVIISRIRCKTETFLLQNTVVCNTGVHS